MISILQLMLKYILPIFVILIIGCHGPDQKELILFDFESDSELDKVHWKCHTLFSLSDENVTHGKKSLRLELFPSEYPGLSPILEINDWGDYKYLNFDMFNPNAKEMEIVVRIDDREDSPDYADRYNHSFVLLPGLNRLRMPLNDLATSGTKRKLDLKTIQALVIFMVNPPEKVRVYIDYIRLESDKARR
jgi:hypothetical protein